MNIHERLKRELKPQGYSTTEPRRLVCETLGEHGPMTMRELVAQIEAYVDRASVYRIVNLFERLGIIRRIPLGWKYKLELSDKFTDHHHHAHCRMCGKIVTLDEDSALERAIEKTAENASFAVEEHHLEMRGVCGDCQG